MITIAGTIINKEPAGHPVLKDRFLKCFLHVQCVVIEEKLTVRDQAACIVDKYDQKGLSVSVFIKNRGTEGGIRLPAVVCVLKLESQAFLMRHVFPRLSCSFQVPKEASSFFTYPSSTSFS